MIYFTEDFTAGDGVLLTAYNFDKVFPSGALVAGGEAEINSNAAIGGAVAVEKAYRSIFATGGQRDHKVAIFLTWDNAAGASRRAGVGVRLQSDGSGYYAVIDSAVGVPVVNVYRRWAGVMSLLATGSLAPLTAADLNGGVTLILAVKTNVGSVKLIARDDAGHDFVDYDDAHADRVEGGGTPGIYFGSTSTTIDVIYDNLVATDFEDEQENPAAFADGLGLIVNGVYLSEYEWKGRKISPVSCKQSYQPVGVVGIIDDLNDAHEPALRAGDRVAFIKDGVYLAEGVLRKVDQDFQPPEGISYEVVGPRDLTAEVPITDPINGAGLMAFNQEPDSDLYEVSRINMRIGQQLGYLWNTHADGEDGLRIRGAAPASADLFDPAETVPTDPNDGLNARIPHTAVSGNVLQGEETLISYAPEYGIFIDPETKVRHLHKRSEAPFKTVRFDLDLHKLPVITTDPNKNRTKFIVRGAFKETTDETFLWDKSDPFNPDGLQVDWKRALEDQMTQSRKYIEKHQHPITGFGVTGGFAYLDLDLTGDEMDIDEWRGTSLQIVDGPLGGTNYTIKTNNATGRVVITLAAWPPPGPNIGNNILLVNAEGSGGLSNGFDDIGRAFTLPGGKQIGKGLCGDAKVTATKGTHTVSFQVKVRKQTYTDPDTGTAKERVKLAMMGIVTVDPKDQTTPTVVFPTPCAKNMTGGDVLPDTIEVTVPVFTIPQVPRIVSPSTGGHRGTAFSFDESKWGVEGKMPGPGDVGVLTPHLVEDANFTDPSSQGAEYQKYADSALAVLSTLARSAQYTLAGIDTSYAGLNKRIQFGDADRLTGFEDATDIWLMEVEWNFLNETTQVVCGTLSAGNVSIEAFRQKFAEKTRLDLIKAMRQRSEEMMACLHNGQSDALGGEGPIATAACQVISSDGRNADQKMDDNAPPKPGDCVLADIAPSCQSFPCHTVGSVDGGGAYIPGSGAIASAVGRNNVTVIKDQITAGAKGSEIICSVMKSLASLWAFALGIAGSHDQELDKARQDLANVRIAGNALADCVNEHDTYLCNQINNLNTRIDCVIGYINATLLPRYDACFKSKSGPPDGVGCLPDDLVCAAVVCVLPPLCTFDFTETVCEHACTVDVQAV